MYQVQKQTVTKVNNEVEEWDSELDDTDLMAVVGGSSDSDSAPYGPLIYIKNLSIQISAFGAGGGGGSSYE
ncbi:MAG: hypothetical protein KME30_32990 [Iphinoe sp. HA4291-MV1]|jgi:hypothetical protein|nr:hypothetical protein [Iphinoe sp. HA4291-MV1]